MGREGTCLEKPSQAGARVTREVPQRSVLGPLLFLILVNDLPNKTNSFPNMFADDGNIMKEVRTIRG